jgi:hypothetical protein
MALHAAVARLCHARLSETGDEHAALRWFRDQGIREPERIAAMIAPGFERARRS